MNSWLVPFIKTYPQTRKYGKIICAYLEHLVLNAHHPVQSTRVPGSGRSLSADLTCVRLYPVSPLTPYQPISLK
ncbi:hypothetical protein M3J09_005041 [Ascochyta lentis]